MATEVKDVVARLLQYAESGFASAHKTDCLEIVDLVESLSSQVEGSDQLLTAQNIIVHRVWELIGGEDPTRADGQNLVSRVREVVSRATAAEGRVALLEEEREELVKNNTDLFGANVEDLLKLRAAEEALLWAMDEIDVLSNKLHGFAYPQGMRFANRTDQLDNYRKAVDVRRARLAKGGQ